MSDNDVKIKVSLDGAESAEKGLRGVGDGASDSDSKLGKLASGGLKGVAIAGAAVAAITIAAGAGLWNLAKGAADAGDHIEEMSQKLGFSIQAYQEWDYIMSQSGVSIDALKGSLQKLSVATDEAINGAGAGADAFARLGISADDLRDKSREDIFDLTIKGLQGVTSETERAAIAQDLLGRGASELAPLLNAGAGSIDEMRAKAQELGLILSDEAVAAGDAFNDSMDTLDRTMQGVKNTIGAQLLPGLTEITLGLAGVLAGTEGAEDRIKAGAETLIGSISDVAPKILGVFSALLGTIITIAPQIIGTLVQGIVTQIPTLVGTLTGAVVGLVGIIVAQAPALITAGVQAIVALATGIASALPTLIPLIVDGSLSMVTALIGAIPLLIEAGIALILGLTEGVIAAIPVIIAALPGLITSVITALLTAIPMLIQAGITLLTSLVAALPEIITSIVEVLPLIISSVIAAVLDSIPLLIEAGIELFIALIGALPEIIIAIVNAIPLIIGGVLGALTDAIPLLIMAGVKLLVALVKNMPAIIGGIIGAVPQIIGALVGAIGGSVGQLVTAGFNLIRGLWQGIGDSVGWLLGKISGFVNQVMKGIKGFFGIASPSTLMADEVGKWLPGGIGIGVELHAEDAIKPISDLNSKILAEAQKLNATVAFTHEATLSQSLVPLQVTAQQPGSISVEATLDSGLLASAISDALTPSGQDRAAVRLDRESIRLLASEIVGSMRAQNRQGVISLG
jgi:phage-related protein